MERCQARETHAILVVALSMAKYHHNSISPSGVAEITPKPQNPLSYVLKCSVN